MISVLAAFAFVLHGLFSVEPVEGLDESHAVALVPRVQDGPVCLWAVSEDRIQCRQPGGASESVALPGGGIKAFDIADADGDGRFEAILLTSGALWLFRPGEATGPTKAFDYAGLAGLSLASWNASFRPHPMVMVVEVEDELALCLPGLDAYALRRLDGTPIRELPTTQDAATYNSIRRAGGYEVPPEIKGLHVCMERYALYHVNPPPELPLPVGDRFTPDGDWESLPEIGLDYTSYPLRQDNPLPRIIVTWPSNMRGRCRVAVRENEEAEFDPKTLRPYPGFLLLEQNHWPDFNGDGYVDLLLCSIPDLPSTPSAVAKVATSVSWGIRATVHCYDPETGRHAVRPSAYFDLEIPLTWFMGRPLKRFALEDVNADGLTDCMWSTAPDSFEVWLAQPGSRFGDRPDFQHTFGEPLRDVEPEVFPMERGPAQIILRGENKTYWLRPEE